MTTTVVVMGVAGCGKSTVAADLASALGWSLGDADELHSPEAVAAMASGRPLTDEDREPWLVRVADWIAEHHRAGDSTVLACSALRRGYRRTLAAAGPDVVFCHLVVPADQLRERLSARLGHFMGPELLASQLATLQSLGADERGFAIDASGPPEAVLEACLVALRRPRT